MDHDQQFLSFIHKNVAMGVSAIPQVLSLPQSRAMGQALNSQLQEYRLLAESLGMDALVEAHDEEEVERALRSGARVIGVNNRNLKDFTVDIGNSLRLRSLVPETIPFVAESGIKSRQQTAQLEQAGVNGVLIGETLMRSPDMKAALAELRGEVL